MQKFKVGTKKMLKGKNRIIHHSKKLKIKARKFKKANRQKAKKRVGKNKKTNR
jgi:hypothetical protein